MYHDLSVNYFNLQDLENNLNFPFFVDETRWCNRRSNKPERAL